MTPHTAAHILRNHNVPQVWLVADLGLLTFKLETMIHKIKGLIKYTDCSMPSNEQERINKAKVEAYNQAIEDVVKLFAIHNVVQQSEQLPCDHLWKSRYNEKRGSHVICAKCSEER